MFTACLTSAVIPWGDTLTIAGREVSLQIADINIGVLWIMAVVGMGVYGIMIGGWASNNKFSLLAACRGASQVISYELPMGLALIALFMLSGSQPERYRRTAARRRMVRRAATHRFPHLPHLRFRGM